MFHKGAGTFPVVKGPFEKIWNDAQCPNIGHGPDNLQDCQDVCLKNPSCTAINFFDGCVLRACPTPIPDPVWEYAAGQEGYTVETCEYE